MCLCRCSQRLGVPVVFVCMRALTGKYPAYTLSGNREKLPPRIHSLDSAIFQRVMLFNSELANFNFFKFVGSIQTSSVTKYEEKSKYILMIYQFLCLFYIFFSLLSSPEKCLAIIWLFKHTRIAARSFRQ